ncbi:MAG: hypothetical protein HY549_00415 [Elusimicrobia bacterium]|nr:hypothetical protein [Elusimicrobiota bacterium]
MDIIMPVPGMQSSGFKVFLFVPRAGEHHGSARPNDRFSYLLKGRVKLSKTGESLSKGNLTLIPAGAKPPDFAAAGEEESDRVEFLMIWDMGAGGGKGGGGSIKRANVLSLPPQDRPGEAKWTPIMKGSRISAGLVRFQTGYSFRVERGKEILSLVISGKVLYQAGRRKIQAGPNHLVRLGTGPGYRLQSQEGEALVLQFELPSSGD